MNIIATQFDHYSKCIKTDDKEIREAMRKSFFAGALVCASAMQEAAKDGNLASVIDGLFEEFQVVIEESMIEIEAMNKLN